MAPVPTQSAPSSSTERRVRSRRSFQRTLDSAKRTMVLSEIMKLAIDSFQASKVRFALTALGMVIGSASVLLVATIGLTGRQYILSELEKIGTNMVDLGYSGGGAGANNNVSYNNDYLTSDDERAVQEQVPSVAFSSPLLQVHDRVSFPGAVVKDVLVLGVSPEYKLVRNLLVTSGRFFDDEDEASHTKVAIVTEPFARQMFGSSDAAISQIFQLKGIPFTIIGTFKESVDTFGTADIDDQTILVPYSVARYFTGTDNVKDIFFSIRDRNDVEEAAKEIKAVIQPRHQPNSVYSATTLTAVLTTADKVTKYLTVMLLLISAVTLAVGGVGIMNIMLATVRSRIREIGIRKALGATAREIKLQFLIEAVFISLSGGLVGTLFGLAIPLSVRFLTDYNISISPWSIVIALTTSVLVGVIFGTLPANRAAQLDPVESLKYE
jgi:putative ABC transport system permease protein